MDSPPAPPTGFDFLYPSPPVLALTLLLIFLTPIFLHFIVFRQRSSHTLPTFLLLGPSSSGKTSLTTTFATPHSPETRTSQAPLSLEATIPASLCASASFRSRNDPSLIKGEVKFTLQDTPGHGKLRDRAVELISADTKGVVFVVDSSAQGWHDAGEYLHAVLLRVQKVAAKRKDPNALFPVLVACNKSDLFTALPATRVRALLEEEVGGVREARSRGIVEVGEEDREDEEGWLGEGGAGRFSFDGLEEVGVKVAFKAGNTRGEGWKLGLGQWIGESL